MSAETTIVITCDFEWSAHGTDDAEVPQDVFTLKQAQRVAKLHQREHPTHKTFRLWSFSGRFEP